MQRCAPWFLTLTLAWALAWGGTTAAAQTPGAAPAPSVHGTWVLDTARLPMPPEARPRSVTIEFAADGSDRLRTRVRVVDPTGATLEADGVTPLDGTPTPVRVSFEADLSATSMPRPDVLIMQLGQGGQPASTRIYTVAPDGQSLTESVTFFDERGQPVLRRHQFQRQR